MSIYYVKGVYFGITFWEDPTLFDHYFVLPAMIIVLITVDVANATMRIDFASFRLTQPREESRRRKLDTLG